MTSSASTGRTQVFYSSFPTNQPGAVEVHYKYMFALEERDGMFFQLSIRPGDGGGCTFLCLSSVLSLSCFLCLSTVMSFWRMARRSVGNIAIPNMSWCLLGFTLAADCICSSPALWVRVYVPVCVPACACPCVKSSKVLSVLFTVYRVKQHV